MFRFFGILSIVFQHNKFVIESDLQISTFLKHTCAHEPRSPRTRHSVDDEVRQLTSIERHTCMAAYMRTGLRALMPSCVCMPFVGGCMVSGGCYIAYYTFCRFFSFFFFTCDRVHVGLSVLHRAYHQSIITPTYRDNSINSSSTGRVSTSHT